MGGQETGLVIAVVGGAKGTPWKLPGDEKHLSGRRVKIIFLQFSFCLPNHFVGTFFRDQKLNVDGRTRNWVTVGGASGTPWKPKPGDESRRLWFTLGASDLRLLYKSARLRRLATVIQHSTQPCLPR